MICKKKNHDFSECMDTIFHVRELKREFVCKILFDKDENYSSLSLIETWSFRSNEVVLILL